MSNIYCGIDKIPKGKKIGSMKQCAEKNQIRYWGLNKVDKTLAEAVRKRKGTTGDMKVEKKIHMLRVKNAGLKGRIQFIDRRLGNKTITESEKNKLKAERKQKVAEFNSNLDMLENLEKQKQSGRQKKLSRKSRRKTTKASRRRQKK